MFSIAFIVILILLTILSYIYRSATKYLFIAPIGGMVSGAAVWGSLAMILQDSIIFSIRGLGIFMLFSIIIAEILMFFAKD